MMCRGFRKTRY